MFKNIGKRIRFLAVLLAILSFVGCLALAAFFLFSALNTADETLRTAGFQGVVISVVCAVLLPMFTWLLYGFGTLVSNSEKQLETEKETKELLRHALSDGALSEEVARKLTQALSKLAPTAAPAQAAPQKPKPLAARPVARPARPAPSVEETAPAEPVREAPPAEPAAPVEPVGFEAPAPAAQPVEENSRTAPIESLSPSTPVAPAPTVQTEQPVSDPQTPPRPVRQAQPLTDLPSTVQPLKPMGGSNKTY
ncbi:MAG: hypothetical protein IJX39_03990 [Clostridia bacterium]|nr:hypothetical protein [Clostridia bacterium]